MKILMNIAAAILCASACRAGIRPWTLSPGRIVTGEYLAVVMDHVIIRDASGERFRIPLTGLSEEDRIYVELENPPTLKIDFLESADQVFVRPSPMWVDNSPVTLLRYRFGARISQKSEALYPHALTVEIYAVSSQVIDPDKYHLVYRWRSDPVRLHRENSRRVELHAPKTIDLAEFRLAGEYPRGERFAESMVVVRDERGEVVACRSTKNWLSGSLDKLTILPQGAWFDRSGRRVHPTSPKPVWFD